MQLMIGVQGTHGWTRRAAMALALCMIGCASPLPQQAPGEPRTPTPEPNAAAANPAGAADTGPLAPLAWLEGCWQGTVNQRDFREQWLPLRGGMLIGAGQHGAARHACRITSSCASSRGTTASTSRSSPVIVERFRSSSPNTTTEGNDTIFTFANTADAFPARLIYRRGAEGWLYADDRRNAERQREARSSIRCAASTAKAANSIRR